MKKLLIYLKNYKKESILGPLFKLLEATFELFVPLVVAAVIDHGIMRGDINYITYMFLILIGLGILGVLSSITAQYYAAKASTGFGKELRHALFFHIQGLSYSEMDALGTSTMITRMTSDMNQVQSGVNMTLRLLLRSPFIVFGAMIMAFTIDFRSGLLFAAAIFILSVVVLGIMLWCIPLYKKTQAKLDLVLRMVRENLTGVRVIRAFCLEEEETRKFQCRNEELAKAQKYVGRISSLMNPLTYIIINIFIVFLIWASAIRVDTGIITQGAVVALYNYMSQILVELIKLANLIITINKSVACGNRIQDVFEVSSSLTLKDYMPAINPSDYIIEFCHVNLCYSNAGGNALADIDFKVRPGEIIGIIGGTGSGKTSLVNMIPRFYDATEGKILLDGVNIKDYPLKVLRDKIGVVPQQAVLFKGTIRDNIKWGRQNATDEEIFQALSLAQAKEVVDSKGGLDYMIEQNGKNLSGGQKQRFTIARALVKNPDLLILDDSASALDFSTDAALRKALAEMEIRPTMFIVSQRTSSIQHCDRIIVMEDGCIAGIGTSEDLLHSCQVYREIYESQFTREN
ncbi:ABC transporter ATP-binding protein [Aminipila terrae]|uniref:ATP-binding cassette domain-containing protein n=1 Tax=Aminipila terrae TaxID=2697030 RepID=A0A6P1MA54_9FIRM|nr:ABC transporter ATP-binding protein [Aminipila terrae]QHI71579.1 ATP-binding cassette domain-containing protein [Aminipila terrae]